MTRKSDVLGLKRVGRSKISENRRTSLMDVPFHKNCSPHDLYIMNFEEAASTAMHAIRKWLYKRGKNILRAIRFDLRLAS